MKKSVLPPKEGSISTASLPPTQPQVEATPAAPKMLPLTVDILRKIVPAITQSNAAKYVPLINEYAPTFFVNTPKRMAAYLSQIMVESGNLVYTKEIWGPSAHQKAYEPPSKKAKELGNKDKGDGRKFLGRGLIQTTGRNNYLKASRRLFGDDRLLTNPALLEQPQHAVHSSFVFWDDNNLNKLADAVSDTNPDITKVRKKVNGGTLKLDVATAVYKAALRHIF